MFHLLSKNTFKDKPVRSCNSLYMVAGMTQIRKDLIFIPSTQRMVVVCAVKLCFFLAVFHYEHVYFTAKNTDIFPKETKH